MTIKQFRRWRPESMPKHRTVREKDRRRGSARERGYDGDWQAARDIYIKSVNHLCEECRRRGFIEPAVLVDHMEPVRDNPERRLDPTNFDALCRFHHDGWKRKLETYARRFGAIALLPRWVKFPETRPTHFQIKRTGPLVEVTKNGPAGR